MKKNLTRRKFIRTAAIGTGITVFYLTSEFPIAAASCNTVSFCTKKARGGCRICEQAISDMLKDRKMHAKLQTFFPADSEVIFFVRRHRPQNLPEGITVAVGNCAKALKNNVDLYIPGCGNTIRKEYIFKIISAAYEKKKHN